MNDVAWDLNKKLRDQDKQHQYMVDLLTPSFNHTHRSLIKAGDRSAKDLTAREIVNNATDWQLEWMRKNGLIA